MQARQGRRQGHTTRRAARSGAAGRKKARPAALLCGLLLCCAAAGAALRACAGQAAPPGSSLKGLVPENAFVFPLGGAWQLSSGYGWRADPFGGAEEFHKGADLACAEGTPVLAAMDGVVLSARRSDSYGNAVRLCHADSTETLYAHLQYIYVRPGELVEAGQPIGTAGQTGRATGPHLHFELYRRALRYDPSAALGIKGAAG